MLLSQSIERTCNSHCQKSVSVNFDHNYQREDTFLQLYCTPLFEEPQIRARALLARPQCVHARSMATAVATAVAVPMEQMQIVIPS